MKLKPYPAYKDSGVEWLGDVPAHWAVERFKRSIQSSRNGVWGDEALGDENDIPCVRVADFDRQRLSVILDEPTIRNVLPKDRVGRQLTFGNLLLEKSGGGENQPVGCVVMYQDTRPAVCSNFVAKVELADGMYPSFWRYMHATAYSIRLTVGSINQTSGIQNLDQGRYFDERACFPPPQEQTTIATFLDRETTKLDTLIAKQEKLIELLQEKRQAVISHAVTKGLDPDAKMKDSGVEWLGDVPENWEVRTISSVCTKITNGYVGPTRDILVDGGVRYLQSLHIKGNEIKFHTPYFVTEDWSNLHKKSILETGDVLIVQTGGIGQAAVVTDDFDGCNCHALIIVSPLRTCLDGAWLSWLLNSRYGFHSLLSIQTGALHPHLNCGNVKDLLLPIPPLTEQKAIVDKIHGQNKVLDTLIDKAKQSIELAKEHRTALISAAVTGKIDVRAYSC